MGITERALDARDLRACQALSQTASWNQNEADWGLMLEIGRGWGLFLADGALAASTIVLPYGGQFAWISMVLVLPAERRRGYASRLLRRALAELRSAGLTPILDATPAGREVYVRQGFHDTWSFARMALSRQPACGRHAAGVRPITVSDWPAILALDARAFGASRERLLRALAERLPAAALILERDAGVAGFLLGRDGREACQLGPLVAQDAAAAETLLAAGLQRVAPPAYCDVAGHALGLRRWLEAQGCTLQRPFTRMVYGAGTAPGQERLQFLVAGPELG